MNTNLISAMVHIRRRSARRQRGVSRHRKPMHSQTETLQAGISGKMKNYKTYIILHAVYEYDGVVAIAVVRSKKRSELNASHDIFFRNQFDASDRMDVSLFRTNQLLLFVF